jgi:hypothetical protein
MEFIKAPSISGFKELTTNIGGIVEGFVSDNGTKITTFVDNLKTNWGHLGTDAKSGLGNFKTESLGIFNSWNDEAGKSMNTFNSTTEEKFNAANNKFKTIWDTFGTDAGTVMNTANAVIDEKWNTFTADNATRWDTWRTTNSKAWSDFTTEISNNWVTFHEEATNSWNAFQDENSENWRQYHLKVNNLWLEHKVAVLQTISELRIEAAKLMGDEEKAKNIDTYYNGPSGEIAHAKDQQNIANAVQGLYGEMVNTFNPASVNGMFAFIPNGIAAQTEPVKEAAKSIVFIATDSINTNLDTTALNNVTSKIPAAMIGQSAPMANAGKSLANSVLIGIDSNLGKYKPTIPIMMTADFTNYNNTMKQFNNSGTFSVGAGYMSKKYATGGIVERATLATIGEKGKEAVVPLTTEALTPWAQAIVNQMALNGGSMGSTDAEYVAVKIKTSDLVDLERQLFKVRKGETARVVGRA